MINHKHKCIFIHIQRTAGSFTEEFIDGRPSWMHHPKEKVLFETSKHLLASQAKTLYKEYWDEYFKFSIVRNPWERMVSCLKFTKHFGLKVIDGKIDLSDYKKKYGFPNTVEYDQRYHKKTEIPQGVTGDGYSNILNEKLDFIASYDNLEDDMNFIFNKIKLNKKFIFRPGASKNYKKYFTEESKSDIELIYKNDLKKYNYIF